MLTVGVLGASGYGGAELIRRLARHPEVRLAGFASRAYAGQPLEACWPQLAGLPLGAERFGSAEEVIGAAEVIFCATPHGATAPLVASALAAGRQVIDLSADFRLDPATYCEWYGQEHPHPELWPQARYGLVELHRDELAGARLVASPGCNATAAALALAPLAAAGLLGRDVFVNIATGISGAGRSPGLALHQPEAAESVVPYRVGGTHRHIAEIEATLGRAAAAGAAARSGTRQAEVGPAGAAPAGKRLETHAPFTAPTITFTPQRVPMTRGILASCAARLEGSATSEGLLDLYRDYYAGDPLVHVQAEPPETKAVAGSDRAVLSVRLDRRSGVALAFAAIDNLGKGASGQAVQGFNVSRGLPETAGLELVGRWP